VSTGIATLGLFSSFFPTVSEGLYALYNGSCIGVIATGFATLSVDFPNLLPLASLVTYALLGFYSGIVTIRVSFSVLLHMVSEGSYTLYNSSCGTVMAMGAATLCVGFCSFAYCFDRRLYSSLRFLRRHHGNGHGVFRRRFYSFYFHGVPGVFSPYGSCCDIATL
jgi:hypothetical protein